MTKTWAKRLALSEMPWDADHPVADLSEDALRILEVARSRHDLGRGYSRTWAINALGIDRARAIRAEREIRSSIFAGQFRPRNRRTIPRSTRVRVFNRDGWRCLECDSRNQEVLTIDHWPVPYGRGGSDHHTNLRTLCKPCNEENGDDEAPTTTRAAIDLRDDEGGVR